MATIKLWMVAVVSLSGFFGPKGVKAALLIDAVRNEFFKLEDELWNYVNAYEETSNDNDPDGYLLKRFGEFHGRLQQLPQAPEYGLNVSRRTYDFIMLFTDLKRIHDLYEKFFLCQNQSPTKEGLAGMKREALVADIVDDVLNDKKNNVNLTTKRIYDSVFTSTNIMTELEEITGSVEYMCRNYEQTPQQVYHHLYSALTLADLKGYILSQFALLISALDEPGYLNPEDQPGNYSNLALEASQQFTKRTTDYIVRFRELMQITHSHNKLWRCDPPYHKEGETYEQITRLLQVHIENEADINRDRSCKKKCGEYSMVNKVYGCYDSESRYCQNRKFCSGRLIGCKEASKSSVCISESSSMRRYDWIQESDGTLLGKSKWCSGMKTPSWIRWFVYCSSCMCLCDEPGRSDRFFNLRQTTSNLEENMVVTGIRLVKHNRIIHVQIQEGKLLPYGYIDQSTVRWVPVDDYKITDWNTKNEIDYYQMSFENRDLALDDVYSHEEDHIITGVGFVYHDGLIKLQVNVRKFDYVTGFLTMDNHYISGASESRSYLGQKEKDIPIYYQNTDQNFDTNKNIKFTHTGLKEDAGQTTIPFIDSQPVTSSPASPLKGVGIHWRGSTESGGFVAPIITAYDFEEKMGINIHIPKRDVKKYYPAIIDS